MKKFYLFSILLLSSLYSFSQNANQSSEVIVADDFKISRPLREIFRENPVDETRIYKKIQSGDRENRKPTKFVFTAEKDGYAYANDSNSIQKEMGTIPGQPTRANVAGQTATGFRPMDPSGAAGPNHYIQMINSTTFRIYNKATMSIALTGTLGNLWSPATANNGDPIVMYDKPADRWFLAQFGSSTDKKIYIAISTTNDPLGTYYTYTYTSAQFPDYLKFSVWADGYYMTSNQSQQKVFCFNRDEMLAGVPAARSVVVNYTPPASGFFVPLPADAGDGTLPAYGTPCPIMSYSDNGWGAGYSDAINLYNMSVNWTPTIPTATISLVSAIPTAAFDASYNVSWNDCVQPGTTQKLDGIGGVLMYRAQWKNWSGYNSIVLNWAVNISSTQRSIKWCELRQDQTSGVWSVYQEGIYTPDAATRWMGSIAMDNNGSIGLTYIKSDATSIYPGLYYTGRRNTDPLGTMPVTEVMAVAGTGFQSGVNRVGDYAHTCLDPDGVTFWTTSEYMGGTSGSTAASTRIYSFQITPTLNTALVNIAQTSGTNPQCPSASATFTATPTNGGTPTYQWKVNGVNVGTNSPTFTTSTLTNGQIVSCVMTSSVVGVLGNPATSNSITMNVTAVSTPTISIAQTTGTNPYCAGSYNVFTATATNGGTAPVYQWKINGVNVGTNSSTFSTTTLTNGQVVSCQFTSNEICTTTSTVTSNSITMNEVSSATPAVSISQTLGSNPFCLGATNAFTATVSNGLNPSYQWKVDGTNVGTNNAVFSSNSLTNGQIVSCEVSVQPVCSNEVTLGNINSTTLNATTSTTAAAYPTYYGNGRQQYLIRASELTALGVTAGNINSIAFKINGTIGDPVTMNDYTIKMGTTTATTMNSTFKVATFSTVFGPVNYTPTPNTINVHPFASPFVWNGTSNILVDICFANQVTGVTSYQNYQTTTTFASTTRYQADNAAGASACTITTGSAFSIRPNMIFTTGSASTNVISNSITLNTTSVQATALAISLISGSNPSCVGSSLTFAASVTNPGTSVTYQWKKNGINVGTNSLTYSSSVFATNDVITCQYSATDICNNSINVTSNAMTLTRNALPVVTASNVSGCTGASIALVGSPAGGTFSKPNPYTGITTTYTYAYTNSNGCSAVSPSATITVNPCTSTVVLKLFIEGYYLTTNLMQHVQMNQGLGTNANLVDNIEVQLVNPLSLNTIAASNIVPLTTNGTASTSFTIANGNYYVVIKYKNAIRTWSAVPVTLNGGTLNYDFTTSANKAFGNNQTQKNTSQWALFSGDIDQNGIIDVSDYSIWEYDANAFSSGYVDSDVDGNGQVDISDYSLWEANNNNFVSEITP